MSDPRVTLCIPTCDGAPWLRDCLDSALSQTWMDYEILVVDDRSEDDTVAIARGVAAVDPRVRVEQNPTRLGLAANWNRSMDLARGTWIKFLFQDDRLTPDCLAEMVESSGDKPGLVVCDRGLEFDVDADPAVRDYFDRLPSLDDLLGLDPDVPAEAVCGALLAHPGVNVFGEPPAVLVHREVVRRFGGFHTGMIQLCDLEFVARIAGNLGLTRVRRELATFRVHGRSASAANREGQQFRKDVLDTLILFHEFAFGIHFAGLRDQARRAAPSVNLSSWAAAELRRARRDVAAPGADPALRAALDRLLREHPRLARPVWQWWHRLRGAGVR